MNLKDLDVAAMSWSDVYAWIMERTPIEDRLRGLTPEQVLSGFTPEQVLKSFTPEQVLSGLTPEQRLAGLSREELIAALPPDLRALVQDPKH